MKGFVIIIEMGFKLLGAFFRDGVSTKFTLVCVMTLMKVKTGFNPRLYITVINKPLNSLTDHTGFQKIIKAFFSFSLKFHTRISAI